MKGRRGEWVGGGGGCLNISANDQGMVRSTPGESMDRI